MNLTDLIARLEKLTGPDREVDARLVYAVKPALSRCGSLEEWLLTDAAKQVRNYTWSVDDALTLVPEDWQWLISNRAPEPHHGRAYLNNCELHFAGISGQQLNPKYRGVENMAATPAIALCLAALNARKMLS